MKTNQRTPLVASLRVATCCLLTLAAGLCAARAADGNPPDRLLYQGYLVNAEGTALGQAAPKNFDVIFRIYNHETASGALYRLWTEMQTVTADKGFFSVVLGEGGNSGGETRPGLSTLFTNSVDASDRYLEMTVRGIGPGGTDSTILPRLRLMTSPYAQLARTAVNAKYLINAGGGQIVRVTGTNVGINRASPATALDVNGTITATALNVSGGVNLSGAVSASSVTASTISGTSVSGTTITASSGFAGPGTIPVGGIIMWSGTEVPAGWALCNGQSSNGRQTPDLRGRFVLASGNGSGLTARTVGQTGGAETHTLTVGELPSHSHSVDPPSTATASAGAHTHNYQSGHGSTAGIAGGNFNAGEIGYVSTQNTTTSSGSHTHSVDIPAFNSANTGSGSAHNNMPPFYVLAFIMRVQ